MGDAPTHSTPAGDLPGREAVTGGFAAPSSNESRAGLGQAEELQSAHHLLQQQQFAQQYGGAQQHAFASQFDATQPLGPGRPSPYNMNAMMNALPQAHYGRGQYSAGTQRYNSGGLPANASGQMQPAAQYAPSQTALGVGPNQQYYISQQAHMQQYYGAPIAAAPQPGNMSPRTAMSYYSGQMVLGGQQGHPQAAYYYPQGGHFPGQPQGMQPQMVAGQYLSSTTPQTDPRLARQYGGDAASRAVFVQSQEHGQGELPLFAARRDLCANKMHTGAPNDSRSNVVRGPPRKPKQSGG